MAVIQEPTEMFKLCVPGLIYAFQNNLYYIALSHLDAAVFYVSYENTTRAKYAILFNFIMKIVLKDMKN